MKTCNANEFNMVILRLKCALGLLQDQEIASALSISKESFAARKKRGSLPKDKIELLCLRRGIDPSTILEEGL